MTGEEGTSQLPPSRWRRATRPGHMAVFRLWVPMASREPLLSTAPLLVKGRFSSFRMSKTLAKGRPRSFHLCPQNPQPFALNARGGNQAAIVKRSWKSRASLVCQARGEAAISAFGTPYTHLRGMLLYEGTAHSPTSGLNLFFDPKSVYWILLPACSCYCARQGGLNSQHGECPAPRELPV